MENIYESLADIYVKSLRMTSLPTAYLSTETIPVLAAFIGLDPTSPLYGRIVGVLQYENNQYRFHFIVHHPDDRISDNEMVTIESFEIVKDKYGLDHIKTKETNFGRRAFWQNTSLADLKGYDEKSYQLRHIMMAIQKYSKEQRFREQLLKTDDTYLAYFRKNR